MDKEEVAENRRKWLEALRSGKYEQTRGQLRSDNSFCCLGVACDISGLGHWTDDGSYKLSKIVLSNTLEGSMPYWLGLNSFDLQNELINLNDARGATFAEIADYAEETFNSLDHFGDPL